MPGSDIELKKEPSRLLHIKEMLGKIISFLNNEELKSVNATALDWNDATTKLVKKHFDQANLEEEYQHFQKLNPCLKQMACHFLINLRDVHKVKKFFVILKLEPVERLRHLFPGSVVPENFSEKLAFASSNVNVGLLLGYIPPDFLYLKRLLCEQYGALILASNLFPMDSFKKLKVLQKHVSEVILKALFQKNGYLALRDKLISLENILNCYVNLSGIEPRVCSITISRNLASFLNRLLSDDGLMLLRQQIISSEFIESGNDNKLLEWVESKELKIFEKLQLKYPPESKEVNHAALTVQKHWRGKTGRRRFSLFKELQDCMSNASIHDVEDLHRAKDLIEARNSKEAADVIQHIKQRRRI